MAAAKLNVQNQSAGDHLNLETKNTLRHNIAEIIRVYYYIPELIRTHKIAELSSFEYTIMFPEYVGVG